MQNSVVLVSCDGSTVVFFRPTSDIYVSYVWYIINHTSFWAWTVDLSNKQKKHVCSLPNSKAFFMGIFAWRHHWRYHVSRHFTQYFFQTSYFFYCRTPWWQLYIMKHTAMYFVMQFRDVWYINMYCFYWDESGTSLWGRDFSVAYVSV